MPHPCPAFLMATPDHPCVVSGQPCSSHVTYEATGDEEIAAGRVPGEGWRWDWSQAILSCGSQTRVPWHHIRITWDTAHQAHSQVLLQTC